MKGNLRTNKVLCDINYREFFKKYTILVTKYSKYTDVVDFSSNLKDKYPKDLLAHYTDGKNKYIFVLLDKELHKAGTNRTIFYNNLFTSADFTVITDDISLKEHCQAPDSITLNLLLNYISSNDTFKTTKQSSVLGKSYFFLEKDGKEKSYRFLEFRFDEDLVLTNSLVTFTEYDQASKCLSKSKMDKKTMYSIDNHRLVFGIGEPCLVLFSKEKGHKDFFNLSDPAETKVSYYELVMLHLKYCLSQVSSKIDFSYVINYEKILLNSNTNNNKKFQNRFSYQNSGIFSKVIIITNIDAIPFSKINNGNKKITKEDFISKVDSFYKCLQDVLHQDNILIDNTIPEEIDKDAFYINLVLTKEDYKNFSEVDLYTSSSDFNVQNITIYTLMNLKENTLARQILKELLIKKDVINGNITIDDFLNFPEDITDFFIKVKKLDGEETLVHCNISDEKKLKFSYENDDPDIFSSDTEYMFKTKDNTTCICDKTSELPLPHIKVIKDKAEKNRKQKAENGGRLASGQGPKAAPFIRENIPEVFDITFYKSDGNLYYFVGDASKGFNGTSIHNSNPIRKITFSNENYSLDGAFFDSMNTDLLSALDASVRPFLYKYCLEWHRINSKSESI